MNLVLNCSFHGFVMHASSCIIGSRGMPPTKENFSFTCNFLFNNPVHQSSPVIRYNIQIPSTSDLSTSDYACTNSEIEGFVLGV